MEYLPIRIGTIRPGAPVHFDVFILVGEKYVHYIREQDPFDPDRVDRLKAKGLKKLYIPDTSEDKYLSYLDAGLDNLKSDKVTVQEKSAIVSNAMVNDAENAIHNVQTEQGFKRTEDRITKVLEFLMSEQGALKSILSSTGVSMDNFQHAANTTSLALGLAGKLGVASSRELLDIGIAALLHDTALTQLGFKADVQPEALSVPELEKYHKHPTEVAHTLAGKPYINRDILELIANHEEVGDGAGFPNKKRLKTLSLSQQVLNLCDAYDSFSSSKGLAPLDAMKQFFTAKLGYFNLDHIKELQTILK